MPDPGFDSPEGEPVHCFGIEANLGQRLGDPLAALIGTEVLALDQKALLDDLLD